MALIKCKECGREISTEAAACPGCGVKTSESKPASSWMQNITHIKCKECGERFSSQEKSCPKCGAKVTIPLAGKIMAAVILLMLAMIIFKPDGEAKSSETAQVSPPAAAPPIHPFKAEDIVVFPQSTIACLSRDNLEQIFQRSMSGEETKARSMMLDNGGDCIMLDPSRKYRLIHVEYNDPEHPDFGIAEVVGTNIKSSSKGAWALTMLAEHAPQ